MPMQPDMQGWTPPQMNGNGGYHRQNSGRGGRNSNSFSGSPLTPETQGVSPKNTPSPTEGRQTTPSMFPPTPSPAFQSAMPMRLPYLTLEEMEMLPPPRKGSADARRLGKQLSQASATSPDGESTPGGRSGTPGSQAAGRLRKQNTGSSGGFPNYGPTPSPVYAQQHVGLLNQLSMDPVSEQFDSLMSWANDGDEQGRSGFGTLPSWEEAEEEMTPAGPADARNGGFDDMEQPRLPVSAESSPLVAAATAAAELAGVPVEDVLRALTPPPASQTSPVLSTARMSPRTGNSPRSPGAKTSRSPVSAAVRSPAHGPAERQSPLQTILEDWPELQPPEILAVDGAKKDGADPNQRPAPPWSARQRVANGTRN